jgi:hypothetical protein
MINYILKWLFIYYALRHYVISSIVIILLATVLYLGVTVKMPPQPPVVKKKPLIVANTSKPLDEIIKINKILAILGIVSFITCLIIVIRADKPSSSPSFKKRKVI